MPKQEQRFTLVEDEGPVAVKQDEEVVMKKSDLIDALRALGEELRKPDPKQAKKELEQEQREQRFKEQVIKGELLAQEQKVALQAQCSHMKENGKYSTGGQMMNDGMALLICSQCSKNWRFTVPPETRRLIEHGDIPLAEMKPPAEVAA